MENNSQVPWWQPALLLFIQLSGWIIVPVVAAMFLGKWLDGKYGTEPWLYIASVGCAFVISMVGIIRETRHYSKQIEAVIKTDKKDKYNNERTDKRTK